MVMTGTRCFRVLCFVRLLCMVRNSVTESASAAAAEAADLLFGSLSVCLTLHQCSHTAAAIFYFMCGSITLYVGSYLHIFQVGQRKVVCVLLMGSLRWRQLNYIQSPENQASRLRCFSSLSMESHRCF